MSRFWYLLYIIHALQYKKRVRNAMSITDTTYWIKYIQMFYISVNLICLASSKSISSLYNILLMSQNSQNKFKVGQRLHTDRTYYKHNRNGIYSIVSFYITNFKWEMETADILFITWKWNARIKFLWLFWSTFD